MRRFLNILKYALLVVLALVVLLPVVLYIPVVQNFVCAKAVSYLNSQNDEMEFGLGKIRIGFPLKLQIYDVTAVSKEDGRVIFGLGKLQTSLDDLSLDGSYFLVKDFEIDKVVLGLDSFIDDVSITGEVENLSVKNFVLQLDSSRVNVGEILVRTPNLAVGLGPMETDSTNEDTSFEWAIGLDKVLAMDGRVKFDMSDISLQEALAYKPQRDSLKEALNIEYFEYNHLNLDKLSLAVSDFHYADQFISANVEKVAARELNSGIEIQQLQTNFLMIGDQIEAKYIRLETPKSSIEGDFSANLLLLDSTYLFSDSVKVESPGYAYISLDGLFASKEIVAFAGPYFPEMYRYWPKENTRLSFDATVTRDTIEVEDFWLKIPNHTDFKLECLGVSPFVKKDRYIEATINGDLLDADFLLSAFVEAPETRQYFIPAELSVDMDVRHRKDYIGARFFVKQRGNVVAEGRGIYDMVNEKYQLTAKTDKLKLTEFMPSLGIYDISTTVDAKGQHFDFPGEKTSLEVALQLDSLMYLNGKGERDSLFDVNVNARLLESKYFAQLTSGHPYIMLDTQLEGEFAKDNVSAQGYIDLQKLDLMHMPQFVAADLGQIAMQSDIMGSYDYGDNAYADILIHTLTYDDGEHINPFDAIDIQFSSEPDNMTLSLESGDALLNAHVDKSIGAIVPVFDTLMVEVARQIDTISLDMPNIQKLLPRLNVDFSIARNNSFYPWIELLGYRFNSINVNVQNNSGLSVNANAYNLYLDEMTRIDTAMFNLKPKRNKQIYDYQLRANYLAPKAKDSYDMHVRGEIHRDSLLACFKYENGKYIKVYDVDAAVTLAYDTLNLHFTDNPVIYGLPFTVNKNNYLQVSQFKDLSTQNLGIMANVDLTNDKDGMEISLFTKKKKNAPGQDIALLVQDLDLRNLSNTLDMGIDMGGKLNSQFTIELLPTALEAKITSDLSHFHIGEYQADLLKFIGMVNKEPEDMVVSGRLTIDNVVKFDLLASLSDSVDFNIMVDDLPLPLVNGFMPNNIQLEGETTGKIIIEGKDLESSDINGHLVMHKAAANYLDCDAKIKLPEDTIRLRRNRLRFREYKMYAANQNPIILDGSVSFRDALDNPQLDLTLRGDKVQVFRNKNRKSRAQYICGTLPADIDMSIKGKVSNLNVVGSVSAREGTDLIYYLEDDPLTSVSKVDELVDFVSFREADRLLADRVNRPYMVSTQDEGLNLALKIDINSAAKVYVHLPTNYKDHVSLNGGGSLQLTSNPDGSLVMSGLYDITGGDVHYKLPMLPVTKDFALDDKSWISWNGDIADPNINLIARERVKSTVNDDAGSRPVMFDVDINIAGTLNSLDVSFDCDAPEDGVISSELSSLTEEERSKQALLLLIAQTYMGPGSSSSAGLSSANAAINSVLNKELESLLTGKMKNTDINVGIDKFDTDGVARTDYSVKVSQRLFNDRVRVTVGGKISSGDGMEEGQNDAMINDVSLEYLTKADGSSYLRLFRKTNYQNILEGEIVETGVGYVQQRSAFRFKNLFGSSKRREQALRESIRAMQEAEKQAERESQRRNRTNRTRNDSIQTTDSLAIGVAMPVDSVAVDSVQHNK